MKNETEPLWQDENNKQIKIIEKATDKAIKQVERERKNKSINYIDEWLSLIHI